jgi:hypothetical protein
MQHIDWSLLREQKAWLLMHDCDEANGLIHLVDSIQDNAVALGMFTEQQVFGTQTEQSVDNG